MAPADARKSRPLRAAFSFLAHSILRGVSGVRPIFDPQAVPVTGVDAHLPTLPAALMEAQALRRHFASVPLAPPEWPGDGGRFPGLSPRQAAVLVPLVDRPEGVSVLLTRRTEQLRHHAGQISFPGGGVDAADADAWAAARREAWEEIGLPGECIEAIGQLPVYGTVTAYQVTPCVGLGWEWVPFVEGDDVHERRTAVVRTPAGPDRAGRAPGDAGDPPWGRGDGIGPEAARSALPWSPFQPDRPGGPRG